MLIGLGRNNFVLISIVLAFMIPLDRARVALFALHRIQTRFEQSSRFPFCALVRTGLLLCTLSKEIKKKQVSRLNETVSRLVDLHMYRRYEGLLSEN